MCPWGLYYLSVCSTHRRIVLILQIDAVCRKLEMIWSYVWNTLRTFFVASAASVSANGNENPDHVICPLCYLSTRIALVAPCCLDEPCLWTTSSSPVAASFIFVSFRLVYAWRTQTNHVINVPCFNWLNTLMNSRTKDICLQLHARQIPAFSDERLHHAVVTDMQMNR